MNGKTVCRNLSFYANNFVIFYKIMRLNPTWQLVRMPFATTPIASNRLPEISNTCKTVGSSVVEPDPELFLGSGIICNGSGSSKNERADNKNFILICYSRSEDSGLQYCGTVQCTVVWNRKWQKVGRFFFLIDYKYRYYRRLWVWPVLTQVNHLAWTGCRTIY